MNRWCYHNCWWLLWADGIAVGQWVFFRSNKPSLNLVLHKLKHVEQCSRYLVFDSWSIAVVRFWCVYVWQWVTVGFSYSKIPFEIEARAAERSE